jgi:hypothetical protein
MLCPLFAMSRSLLPMPCAFLGARHPFLATLHAMCGDGSLSMTVQPADAEVRFRLRHRTSDLRLPTRIRNSDFRLGHPTSAVRLRVRSPVRNGRVPRHETLVRDGGTLGLMRRVGGILLLGLVACGGRTLVTPEGASGSGGSEPRAPLHRARHPRWTQAHVRWQTGRASCAPTVNFTATARSYSCVRPTLMLATRALAPSMRGSASV